MLFSCLFSVKHGNLPLGKVATTYLLLRSRPACLQGPFFPTCRVQDG